jgi:hypothetical protein
MKIRSLAGLVAATFLSALLGACGGGGSSDSAAASGNDATRGPFTGSAEGFYIGGLVDGTNRVARILVLENDELWALYGTDRNGPFLVQGFYQASGTSDHHGGYNVPGIRDFGAVPPVSGSLFAAVSGTSFGGAFDPGAGPLALVGVNGGTDANFPYDTPAVLADIVGAWSLTSRDGTAASVVIGATGAITASSSGCALTGTIAPRASGKNVFDVNVTMGAAPCSSPGTALRGIGLTHVIAGTNTRELIVAGVDANRTAGAVFFGTR